MRLSVKSIYDRKKSKEKMAVLTAYDYPMAKMLDESGVDVILIGDSLGMVLLGYETTIPVTMRDMIYHSRAVSRAVQHALVVGDMPFGSYDTVERALRNAKRFMQDAKTDAIKLEGAFKVKEQVKALVKAGIPVMGHIGMTPQTASAQGGFKVQGRTTQAAKKIIDEAKLLEDLGVFSMVLECVPADLAKKITAKVKCPTIGIGAGPFTDGQVLVLYDMLGISGRVKPKFIRRYASLETNIRSAAKQYVSDVKTGKYPSLQESF